MFQILLNFEDVLFTKVHKYQFSMYFNEEPLVKGIFDYKMVGKKGN